MIALLQRVTSTEAIDVEQRGVDIQ